MKFFLQTLLLGLLGLGLTVAFPELRLDWLALVLAAAFLSGKRLSAWSILAVLSYLYSTFSMAAAWEIALPFAAAWGVFNLLRKNVSLSRSAARIWLLSIFCMNTWLAAWVASRFRVWSLRELLWGVLTVAVGAFLLPCFRFVWNSFQTHLLQRLASGIRLPLRNSRSPARTRSASRKPFGLEKGL